MVSRIFLVEDSAAMRAHLIVELTGVASAVVGTAQTEEDGKHWLRSHPQEWDIAVVDVYLREGSGVGILRQCRERRDDQKVFVVTNHATPLVIEQCLTLGANRVFNKAGEIDALIKSCKVTNFSRELEPV